MKKKIYDTGKISPEKAAIETEPDENDSRQPFLKKLLFGEEHLQDTMQILSVIDGKTVKELLEMNGTELIADAMKAFNEQLKPFFTQIGISVGKQ